MATKKDARGKPLDLTARVLIEIRDEVRRTNARLDQTNERLETGFAQVNARLDQTNARLDNLRDIAGERYRELDVRVRALEARAS